MIFGGGGVWEVGDGMIEQMQERKGRFVRLNETGEYLQVSVLQQEHQAEGFAHGCSDYMPVFANTVQVLPAFGSDGCKA